MTCVRPVPLTRLGIEIRYINLPDGKVQKMPPYAGFLLCLYERVTHISRGLEGNSMAKVARISRNVL